MVFIGLASSATVDAGAVGYLQKLVADLAASTSPIFDIFGPLMGLPTTALGGLIVAAVVNGALVQIVMASRMRYGLARRKWLPPVFAMIGTHTRTPLAAVYAVAAVVVATAAAFPNETLARVTSLITLLIFVAVNASLPRDRGRAAAVGAPGRIHAAVPANGLAFSLGLAGFQVIEFLRGAADDEKNGREARIVRFFLTSGAARAPRFRPFRPFRRLVKGSLIQISETDSRINRGVGGRGIFTKISS